MGRVGVIAALGALLGLLGGVVTAASALALADPARPRGGGRVRSVGLKAPSRPVAEELLGCFGRASFPLIQYGRRAPRPSRNPGGRDGGFSPATVCGDSR